MKVSSSIFFITQSMILFKVTLQVCLWHLGGSLHCRELWSASGTAASSRRSMPTLYVARLSDYEVKLCRLVMDIPLWPCKVLKVPPVIMPWLLWNISSTWNKLRWKLVKALSCAHSWWQFKEKNVTIDLVKGNEAVLAINIHSVWDGSGGLTVSVAIGIQIQSLRLQFSSSSSPF